MRRQGLEGRCAGLAKEATGAVLRPPLASPPLPVWRRSGERGGVGCGASPPTIFVFSMFCEVLVFHSEAAAAESRSRLPGSSTVYETGLAS